MILFRFEIHILEEHFEVRIPNLYYPSKQFPIQHVFSETESEIPIPTNFFMEHD